MTEPSMTSENNSEWAKLSPEWHLRRLRDWAEMLEKRVAELDPYYRGYPWGRTTLPPKELPE